MTREDLRLNRQYTVIVNRKRVPATVVKILGSVILGGSGKPFNVRALVRLVNGVELEVPIRKFVGPLLEVNPVQQLPVSELDEVTNRLEKMTQEVQLWREKR